MKVELLKEDGTMRVIEKVGGCTTSENELTIILMNGEQLKFDIINKKIVDKETKQEYVSMREIVERTF